MKAASLTTLSMEIAIMRPSLCSVALIWRVPKAMAKPASTMATPIDTFAADDWCTSERPASRESSTVASEIEIAFNCSAMYGTAPITAMIATSAATCSDLP